jgi:flagellin
MSAIDAKTSLVALQGMKGASRDIAQASERLVTGKRINRASDDPAGFAQAVRLQAEIGSYNQVRKNINEAIPQVGQAGDSLNQIADYLVEMRSIALLAKNEADATKRATYQDSFAAYRTAIEDVITLDPMLDSSAVTLTVQTGVNSGNTKGYVFAAISTTTLGINASTVATDAASATAAITALDTAIETVLGEVGVTGGYQNSLQFTADYVDNTILNKTVQYRDLTDADMALEATNLAAAKIRQDASTAVLAQANSMNRSVADYLLNGALG